jgi:uncharacterized membrane protein YfbV (UPF0208 family)
MFPFSLASLFCQYDVIKISWAAGHLPKVSTLAKFFQMSFGDTTSPLVASQAIG